MQLAANAILFSRPQAAAARLGEFARDQHRFLDKRVLLTGDVESLTGPNGEMLLLCCLRLLVRITRHLTVSLPSGSDVTEALTHRCRAESERIAFADAPVVFDPTADVEAFDAVLSIGMCARTSKPQTAIMSDGWLANVSSPASPLRLHNRTWNPVGALGAAALGVTEVFKHVVGASEGRAPAADGTPFSFYSYESGTLDVGPPLPSSIRVDGILVGCGAIGNGVVAVLAELPLTGRLAVVDRQQFTDENLATCLLIGEQDVGRDKAAVAVSFLPSGLDGVPFSESIESYAARVAHGWELPPRLVVNALDNVDARRDAQNLWPDLAIDGAIGDFMVQVTRHPWGENVACIRCVFPPRVGERSEIMAARATGLHPDRTAQVDDVVRESDVECAPPELRKSLQAQIGLRICSVVSTAVLAQIAAHRSTAVFEPSTAFVAALSSAMVAGELVKAACGWTSTLAPGFQFDALVGPWNGVALPQRRRHDCICTTRAGAIERLRALRTKS